MKNWQAHSNLTILAGYAPQESGPSEHKEHFWDHVTKTMTKLPRCTSTIFGGDFNGDPMPDDAPIGRHHPCQTLTDTGAHISEISAATQLWSPATWSARSLPPEPSWEGSTWRGHNGVQSRPDHILLSVDLASPPVTVDFRSSRNLMRTALAPIDHAPLRIALQYRFRAADRREKSRRPDRAKLAEVTRDLHFAKPFIEKVQKWQIRAGNTWKVLFSIWLWRHSQQATLSPACTKDRRASVGVRARCPQLELGRASLWRPSPSWP